MEITLFSSISGSNELMEYRFFKKYPKLFAVSVLLFGIVTIDIVLHQIGLIG